jgi:hypothetical protein
MYAEIIHFEIPKKTFFSGFWFQENREKGSQNGPIKDERNGR